MYYHKYIYGPDPYHMTPPVFVNITFAMFYSNSTTTLSELVPSILGNRTYVIYASQSMITKGPSGPDFPYVAASPLFLQRFDTSPDFGVIYTTGQTLLAIPSY